MRSFTNPLETRYASKEMLDIFTDENRFRTWRKIWIALAEAEKELGLDITGEQIAQMKANADNIDFKRAEEIEREIHHDVMSHIRTFSEAAPAAAPILHLGATSDFVNGNSDAMLMRDAMKLVKRRLVTLIDKLRQRALEYADLPILGYTHLQPAQPTTLGKRISLWLYDLVLDLEELDRRLEGLVTRGAKGTTGTQASYLKLFEGDGAKVRELDRLVAGKLGFAKSAPVTGQTMTRKFDFQVLSALASIAQSAHRAANDIRLMQHNAEVEEPFSKKQVGSSAMPYKRNPVLAERMSSLARYLTNNLNNSAYTHAFQMFERTLDDSANRRLLIPECFLLADAVLIIYQRIAEGMNVYPEVIKAKLKANLPFFATENILMESVKHGGNRQELHETIREFAMKTVEATRSGGSYDMLGEMRKSGKFPIDDAEWEKLGDFSGYVGRAPEQVREFVNDVVNPLIEANKDYLGISSDIRV